MSAEAFKDHFSSLAATYAAYRPVYPAELAQYLASLAPSRKLAWDAGCGSGQLSTLLGDQFERVIATDASDAQLAEAKPHPHVEYRCTKAESAYLEAKSVDLATVAQAVHWFDIPAYFAETKRALKPGGVVAIIAYGGTEVPQDAALDALVKEYYYETLGDTYWPPERRIVDDQYRTLDFPFAEIMPQKFTIDAQWDFEQLKGYFSSWSATKAILKSKDADQWPVFLEKLAIAWGDKTQKRPIKWPIFMRVGRV